MAHDTVLNSMSGGDTIVTYDLATGGAYPTAGKVPASVLYVGATGTTTPTPVTAANPLYVSVQNASLAVTAASLPLPAGAATSANQASAVASLASLDGKAPALGQALAAASVPVVLTAAQLAALTPVSTVTANAGSGTFAVSAASLPLPSGAATEATLARLAVAQGASLGSNTQALVGGSVATAAPTYTTGQVSPLSLTTAGAVRVDGSAVTQPVSGTVTANVGTTNGLALDATLTGGSQKTKLVDSGGTNVAAVSAGGALKVDGSAATQPVSAASLPLPTGAATAANQSAASSSLASIDGKMTACNTGAVTVSAALPAGTNNLGSVNAQLGTGTMWNGTTSLTPKFAAVSASSSGSTNVVAAVTSKKIRVLKFTLSSSGAVNAKFVSNGGSPTDLTGLTYLTQFSQAGSGFCPVGHFETAAGEALALNLSAAVAVGGVLTYLEI